MPLAPGNDLAGKCSRDAGQQSWRGIPDGFNSVYIEGMFPDGSPKDNRNKCQRTAHGFAGECERVALLLNRAQSQVDADAHVPRPGFLHQVWSVQRLDTPVAHTHEALLQAGEFEAIVTRTKRFKRDCRHPRRASWMTFRTMTSVDLWLAVLWMGIANSCPSTFADSRHGEPDLSIYGGDQASRRSSAGWVIDQRCTISHGGSVRQTSSDRGAVRLGRPETR